MLTIDYIQTKTNAKIVNEDLFKENTTIEVVDFDTRRLHANSLYVALTIGATDGHLYIEKAIEQGAVAVLVSKESAITDSLKDRAVFLFVDDTLLAFQALAKAYRQDLGIPVIGITGSNGKTTSKDVVASLLGSKLSVHSTYKNFNNHLGVPLTLLQANSSHDVIVLEMGMNHKGELDVLGNISKPNFVVITNIGESHIEHLGSRENIAHAKGELLPHLQKDGIAFLPGDCEFKELLSHKTNEKKILFKIGAQLDNPFSSTFHPEKLDWDENEETLIAHEVEVRDGFTFFEVGFQLNDIVERYHIPLYGEHNVKNTLPAIFLAKEFGFSQTDILKGLENLHISPMRFERVEGKNQTLIINDAYNASPTSMKKSSETFLDIFNEKHRLLVLGDMFELGNDSLLWHKSVGQFLNDHQEKIEFLVTVGKESRAISGAFNGRSRHFTSKDEASKFLEFFLNEEFVLLFKASRGMKLESIVESLR